MHVLSKNMIITNRYKLQFNWQRKTITNSDVYFGLVCFLWSYRTLVTYFSSLLAKLPLIGFMFKPFIMPAILVCMILFLIPYFIKRIRIKDLLFICIIAVIALLTIIMPSEYTNKFDSYAATFFIQCLPAFLLGTTLQCVLDNEKRIKTLAVISNLVVVSTPIVLVVTGFSVFATWSENMYYPYLILPHMLLIYYQIMNFKNKLLNICIFIFGTLFMIMMGNRGAILCLATYVVVISVWKLSILSLIKKISLVIVVMFATVITVESDLLIIISNFVIPLALKLGFSTRLFDYLSGSISGAFDSGRSSIVLNLLNAISDNPLGYGLASDTYFNDGAYAHNLVIELLVEFGVVFGCVLTVLIIYIITNYLLSLQLGNNNKELVWIFICSSLVKLMVSGTYLQDPQFFLLIGICSSQINVKHVIRQNDT